MLRRADILHVQAAVEANTASAVTAPQLESARSVGGNSGPLATAHRLNQEPPQAELSPPPALVSGDLVIDTSRRTVIKGGLPVALKPKEFDLLAFLVSHPLQVFSREVLLDRVWGYDFVGGARTVDVHIRWLRSKLEPNPDVPEYILTVYGVGYKFNQAVKTKG
jgi:DNA-binding response OmpR family regulator